MADEVKAAPAAPAAAPVVASTPTPVVKEMNAQREATVGREGAAPGGDPAAAETAAASRNQSVRRSSPLITNPAPIIDPDAPVVEKPVDEDNLPASTRAEMEAGRNALQRNKPASRENNRPTNPVDQPKV